MNNPARSALDGAPAIRFRREAGLHTIEAGLWLPRSRDEVFPFFADAFNLEAITPASLGFTILTPPPITMRQGARIDYQLRINSVPVRWQSEITSWEPPHRFVDEQRRGPYRVWIHEHIFEERDGGTLVMDRVRYAVPGGAMIERLLVRPQLRKIFTYRRTRLSEIFS
jgi:ligand-binding SRPBCC domain-containing protein